MSAHSRGSIWKFCVQNFEWNFVILNFTIHHGNPNYTIFCLISVQSYVYTRFFNGWTWCNLSCPWFEWIFEMSMNKTQLPINGIIKFRKIFAKILKDSEKFWKLGKLNFSFFRIWKMRLSLARMMSVWNISIKRTSGILLTYGHFRIRTFLSVRVSFVTCSSVINDPLEFTHLYRAKFLPKISFFITKNFQKNFSKFRTKNLRYQKFWFKIVYRKIYDEKNFGKNFETHQRYLIMNEHELCYRKNDMRTKNCKTPFLSE